MKLGAMQDWPLRVTRLIDHAEREHGDGEIVTRWADGSITRTNWSRIARDARRVAGALDRLGVRPGERVGTLAMNHDRHLACWYGAPGMGAVLHTLNPRLFDEQLVYIANHAEDRVLLYDRQFAALVERLKPKWTTIDHYICFDDEFPDWIAGEPDDRAWAEGDERDLCNLCYTSGTTGDPKGVAYEHRSNVLHAMIQVAPDMFDLSARSVLFPIVPLFHANGWAIPWAAPLVGCKLILSAAYQPDEICALFRDEAVTHSAGVPTVWLGMIEHAERTAAQFSALRRIIVGGSAAPKATIRWFKKRSVEVVHAWGMTETSPIGTMCTPKAGIDQLGEEQQLDFISRQGRVPFGVEIRVVDDDGNALPRDGVSCGQLQVRGDWVLKRYFGGERDSTGLGQWFDTGDGALIHPDGTMQITDRIKDLIKSGGEWISSIELENAAIGCPGVAEAAAIGIAHPKWDERPLLLVVRSSDSEVGEPEIRDHLAQHVAKWSLPDAIEFVAELPHTASGKLSKKILREQYRDYRFANAGVMVGRD
jgi:acyl-CoA synthetase (AMP-forming)/AMP-acid ligase II